MRSAVSCLVSLLPPLAAACYTPPAMSEVVLSTVRDRFCARCDAPLYSDQSRCGYCGGGASAADAHAVFVLSLLVLSALAVLVLALS